MIGSRAMSLGALFSVVLVASCSGDDPPAVDASGRDAARTDAGARDAGARDAGRVDAGSTDTDAGTAEMDAGTAEMDAGSTDVDAGSTDMDAGSDAGTDAGSDAGPPPSTVEGTWVGPLSINGVDRQFTYVLHARASGDVMGYMPGGTSFRTITGGTLSADGTTLDLDFLHVDPVVTRMVHVTGTIAGDTFTGTSTEPSMPARPVVWTRTTSTLSERRFVVSNMGGAAAAVEVAVVLDGTTLVSGGLVERVAGCTLAGCGAGVSSFSDVAGPPHRIVIGWVSGCASGTITMTETVPGTFAGLVALTPCAGPVVSRSATMAIDTASRTTDALEVLRVYGSIADALEAGAPVPTTLPISIIYRNAGVDRAGLLAALDAQVTGRTGVRVEMRGFRTLVSETRTDTDPALAQPFNIRFQDRRTADAVPGPGRVTLQDTDTSTDSSLRWLATESGAWVVFGDQL